MKRIFIVGLAQLLHNKGYSSLPAVWPAGGLTENDGAENDWTEYVGAQLAGIVYPSG